MKPTEMKRRGIQVESKNTFFTKKERKYNKYTEKPKNNILFSLSVKWLVVVGRDFRYVIQK